MTQIALNARFHLHRPTGMQRYALELSRRFADHLDPVRPAMALGGTTGHLWEQLYLPSAVRGRLLWSPNNTGPLVVERQVCTIHDLIPLDHPEWFNRRFGEWYSWLLPRLAKRVRHMIAISDFTKDRIVKRLGVSAEKVTVIPNGVDSRFSPRNAEEIERVRRALGITPAPYLLYVGSLEPRKNLPRLLAAWRTAQSSAPKDVRLIIAGARGSKRVFGALEIKAVPPRTEFIGYVPDEHLPELYSGAVALVYPSLYEGFGLPPLEAMACGTPVVTSDGTSLPEVVGDNAVLVDPHDADSIAEGLVRVLSSPSLRDAMSREGRKRAARFTWEQTAHQTLQLLLAQTQA
jgi:glycosyltransferase involved in cell wall biosynthesis